MRILLVNWAKIWDGASGGGGVNGYCQALALELAARGHEVAYLFGGVTATPRSLPENRTDPTSAEPCCVRRHPDWLGIRVFEVVDSPVLAPAAFQFKSPLPEARSPVLAGVVSEFVQRLAPDIVHFHNIEGLSADCVHALRDTPAPRPALLYSLHNYHTICPQAYLLHRYLTPCTDFEGGIACETCIDAVDPQAERSTRARNYLESAGLTPLTITPTPVPAPTSPSPKYDGRLAGVQSRALAHAPPVPLPGFPCDDDESVRAPRPTEQADARGQTAQLLAERQTPAPPGPLDPAWRPVRNVIPHELRVDPDDPASNRYGVRRSRMVDALNACDRVLAVSRYVRDRFEAAGVRSELLKVQHIGTRINRVVERLRDLAFPPPPIDPNRPRPIRIVFMGYNNVYKGLPMLADALELFTPEYLARFHLSIFAQAGQSIEWRFRRMEPRLGGLSVYHGYQPHDIPWMLGGKDLGLVTSIWWDNAPQTVFEFLACGVPVLGANIGGIPDFIQDGQNGLLFTANDRFDLARRLAEVARAPTILASLRQNVRPPKDIAEHALELETTYSECLSSLSPPGGPREGPVVVVAPGVSAPSPSARGSSSVPVGP